jgi:DNA-binding MarR family transcriptional regulator
MLRSLYDGDAIAPSALARNMGMTKGAVSKLADRLLHKGLIGRSNAPGDKRSHSLSLSAAGREKVPVLAGLADGNDAEFFTILRGEEQEQQRHLLNRLIGAHGLTAVPID